MKFRLRLAATVLVLLAIAYIAHWSFALLNMPSDTAVLLGTLSSLAVLILSPSVLRHIWKKDKNEETTTT